jgi:hypothetical protein
VFAIHAFDAGRFRGLAVADLVVSLDHSEHQNETEELNSNVLSTFMASTQGSLDHSTVERAAEHVQIVAVILYRWYAVNPLEATEWVEGESQMKPLWKVLTNLRTP